MTSFEQYIHSLQSIYLNRIKNTNTQLKRYLYSQINWEARLICIRGARGTGKTTLLLQYIKEHYKDLSQALYISLDNLTFQIINLYDVAEYANSHSIKALFIDEVHYVPNWGRVIKSIFDTFPELKIVYTGSSMLQLDESQVDLARRQTVYELYGFSFREYLEFTGQLNMKPYSLEQLLNEHVELSMTITEKIKPLVSFATYLKQGYYPYCLEAKQDYLRRMEQEMKLVIGQDIPLVEDISFPTLQKAQKLLMVLATQVPLEPNISTLCREIGCTRDVIIKLLNLMEKAGLLMLVNKEVNSYKSLSKPDKIYLNNTNQMYALTFGINVGTLRETFFANQLRQAHSITLPPKGDFLVDNTHTFEVGGRGKTFKQIKDIENSYIAMDDIEYGTTNCIPLYLFGFLY